MSALSCNFSSLHYSIMLSRSPAPLSGDSNRSRKKMRSSIVAAAPAAEDRITKAAPLTKLDLVDYLASGCKPKSRWRIGTEHEKFGFDKSTLKPLDYPQISQLFEGLCERFNWQKEMEGDKVTGLKKDGQSISLEPGGQLELSGAPLETLHATCAELSSHLYEVKAVSEEMGVGFFGMGFHPKWPVEVFDMMPKGRFQIMRNYLPKVGKFGLDTMFRTCTVQVNLDFSSEEDMVKKFRVSLALQPVVTAIFANSPFTEGAPNGYLSYRSLTYTDMDGDRTGDLPFVFEDGFSFERYVDYALEVPMVFVYRDGKHVDCTGRSFKDFLLGRLPELPGELPTLSDWENHINTIYPEVRLKKYLEMRGADEGPWKRLCALPALWVGLLYDEEALESAYQLIEDWSRAERAMLRREAPKLGLKTRFRNGTLKDVAQEVLELAKEGLERRGYNEVKFLEGVAEIVETGVTPAERLLELYNGKWNKCVDPMFHALEY
ncbi:glutamate--cysteine ligase, chloroplastic isoform X1 [Selaginella moellendorffii]|nr:glutamate--cysteine ligase, chloroplastic isoform X1 [Selaginella moellendorffii]|eukprot:XP_002974231.2 glutamate--cysteine ligase, chloroplastic isoform X1 [Selaginella moellendorffii]